MDKGRRMEGFHSRCQGDNLPLIVGIERGGQKDKSRANAFTAARHEQLQDTGQERILNVGKGAQAGFYLLQPVANKVKVQRASQ